MTGYNFTRRVRRALHGARDVAAEFGHEYIGTEHILVAVLRERGCVAGAILTDLGINPDVVEAKVRACVKPGIAALADKEAPYTSRAKKVLEFAMMAARDENQSPVGTQHLLLALLREGRGIGGQVLVHSGVTLAQVTAAVRTMAPADENTE